MAKKKTKSNTKTLIFAIIGVICAAVGIYLFPVLRIVDVKENYVYIYPGTTKEAFIDSVRARMGDGMADGVSRALTFTSPDFSRLVGAYKVQDSDQPLSLLRKLKSRQRESITITFNNVRTPEQLADKICPKLMMSREELLDAIYDEKLCQKYGLTPKTMPAMLLNDSYQFFWEVKPEDFLDRIHSYYEKFWNEDRRAKAAALGVSPVDVTTVASIAEEETAKRDERGKVGRLYLNRVKIGMKLQADPTVKYAIGDFTIRRISGNMLSYDSPYNTYRYAGLPPGPIRFVDKTSIDAVLDAAPHDYIYMCAKEDFSGYHNFSTNYGDHMANARRYQSELNKRGIH